MRRILLFLLISLSTLTFGQNLKFARKVIDSLGSPYLHGRAYCTGSDKLAANYIVSLFKQFRVKPINDSYLQKFTLSKNCITDSILLIVDGTKLELGKDYIIWGNCPTLHKSFKLKYVKNPKNWAKLSHKNLNDVFLVVDYEKIKSYKKSYRQILKAFLLNRMQAAGIVILTDRIFYYKPFEHQKDYALVFIKRDAFPKDAKMISLSVNSHEQQFTTQNIIGYVPGRIDSFVVFTAHYDHLGVLGQVYFPGANDNASGTAMVLDLAHWFANRKTPPKYNVAFILFSGEEMGLLGSMYFVEHPVFDLNKIKLLVNLDMVGSGDQGITIVNGKEHPEIVEKIKKINEQYHLLPDIGIRPNAPNSDHYPFTLANVPAIFIYTRGEYKEYHNIYDRPDKLPLNKFAQLKKLLYILTGQL